MDQAFCQSIDGHIGASLSSFSFTTRLPVQSRSGGKSHFSGPLAECGRKLSFPVWRTTKNERTRERKITTTTTTTTLKSFLLECCTRECVLCVLLHTHRTPNTSVRPGEPERWQGETSAPGHTLTERGTAGRLLSLCPFNLDCPPRLLARHSPPLSQHVPTPTRINTFLNGSSLYFSHAYFTTRNTQRFPTHNYPI